MAPPIRFFAPRRPTRRRRPAPRPSLLVDGLERRELLAVPGLSLTLASHSIAVNAGAGATVGTVTRTGADTTRILSVKLTSSDPTAVVVPAWVYIQAGQIS